MSRRREIADAMARRLGPAAPGAGAPASEVLRRVRSDAVSALRHGERAALALDGLRAVDRRVIALLAAWSDAAAELAGAQVEDVGGQAHAARSLQSLARTRKEADVSKVRNRFAAAPSRAKEPGPRSER